MSIPVHLKEHLEKAHASYSPVAHIPARSSQYAASLLHIPGKEVAKTVVLRAGSQVLLAVLPASHHVNLKNLAGIVGTPVELIEEQECYRLFPDCQHGAVPPFGELYGLSVYMDKTLADSPEIIFSAGTLTEGIRMGYADFVHLAKPWICSFAEKGNVIGEDDLQDLLSPQQGGGK